MPTYRSPGVYVEEVPSAIKAIAGVSTSIPGFIGIVPDTVVSPLSRVKNEAVGIGNGESVFDLASYPVQTDANFEVRVDGVLIADATLSNDDDAKVSRVTFTTAPTAGQVIIVDYQIIVRPPAVGSVELCTNFTKFKQLFGDFSDSSDPNYERHSYLVHAVYGFFNNGGGSCYITRVTDPATELDTALNAFAAIDPIALVVMPGETNDAFRDKLVTHCKNTGDRFAILDGPETASDLTTLTRIAANGGVMPKTTDFAAYYFPRIEVFDPVSGEASPVPPSGHLAGIYARVDNDRGVHKAPANEVIFGALNVSQAISKADQNNLNPQGVNCIRILNGNILVWGGRTVGGDSNADLKYINVRRTLLFISESIDEGLQWVVFEPNDPGLWQKITRNVSGFLLNVWRSGALFGNTPQEAFYVKCDAETNPSELRELGQVVTEIGVSIVRPAEFVIFRISQFTSPG
ncbi:MAG: phage tail sheath subtilisin-like domain-containing protein [Cyanobacteria bacterium P01_F01_bin.150]